tara:strand:+ start:2517 stop:3050 length:534 start_codon:yes stop_codon:yes gene_type:complete
MSKKKNKGGNSDLDGKYWNCPDYVLNCFKNAVKTFESTNKDGKQTEGYKRAKNILEQKMIEYKQMKRMKNWFDKFEGDHNDIEYRLNGGSTTRNWVESTLNKETQAVKAPKKIKGETGLSNQFIKQHNKNTNKVNRETLKMTLPKLSKDISGQISRGKPVYEEVTRIKKLITYKSKI